MEFGVDSAEVVAYDIYINYPVDHRLALLEPIENESAKGHQPRYNLKHEFNLEEDVLEEDPTTGLDDRIPTFHGYSANGNVTAQYVYVNFGTFADYDDLVKANVSLKGKIAVAKYGRIFRGLKVKRAQELGMVGAVLYDDPQEDGEMTEENGYKPYPEGPARNPSAIQRGSVQFLSILPGDPTTPGYPSLPGAPREDPHLSIPSIPSLPISYSDAIILLKGLNGHGLKASDFNEYWQGGKLGSKGVEYNIGPSPPELVLNLVNEVEYVTTPLWNTIGVINGTIKDEVIIMGNHRDACKNSNIHPYFKLTKRRDRWWSRGPKQWFCRYKRSNSIIWNSFKSWMETSPHNRLCILGRRGIRPPRLHRMGRAIPPLAKMHGCSIHQLRRSLPRQPPTRLSITNPQPSLHQHHLPSRLPQSIHHRPNNPRHLERQHR